MPSLFIFLILFTSIIDFSVQNNFGPMCLPERRNYRKYYPCEQDPSSPDAYEDRDDRLTFLKGEPSTFARSGFYDRLFRQQNMPQVYSDNQPYYPNYGYNPNLPINGPYRYTNWFAKSTS